MAIFGKALGNGYAINSVIGKRSIMNACQSTFVSSTFWTERIGPTAALKTLEIMKRDQTWETITEIGLKVREIWLECSQSSGIPIQISGIPSLSTFSFLVDNHLALKTYLTQSMLQKGFLASTIFYASISHSDHILEDYRLSLSKAFKEIAHLLERSENVSDQLTDLFVMTALND